MCESVDAVFAFVAHGGIALGVDLAGFEIVQDDGFGGHQLRARLGRGRRQVIGNNGDAVAIAVNEITRVNHDIADVHRDIDLRNMTITVGTDDAVGETREMQGFDLIQVACLRRW